jgi:hypothetical protein
MQCDGKQVSIAPNTCSSDVLSATYDSKGIPANYKLLKTGDLLKLS